MEPRRKLLAAMAGLGVCFLGHASPREALAQLGASQAPSRDEFYFKVENLVDNVVDLQVWRFTVLALEGRTLRFRMGKTNIGSRGVRTPDDPPGVRRLEVVLILRLTPFLTGYARTPPLKLRAFTKLNRDKGGTIETDYDVPQGASLSDLVSMSAASGHSLVGKPFLVGKFLVGKVDGGDVILSVE